MPAAKLTVRAGGVDAGGRGCFLSSLANGTIATHDDILLFEPDSLLSVPSHIPVEEPPIETALRRDANHSLEHFIPILYYTGDERCAGL